MQDAWFFKIGVSSQVRWFRRLIVPSFDAAGSLNFFVARAIDHKRRPKYDMPDGVKSTDIIFNELNIDWKTRLVLCEGAFDLMKCPENSVPLLGSTLNEQSYLFNMIIANGTPVALALDGDMWNKKTPRAVKSLEKYDIHVDVVDTRSFHDPGSVSKKEFGVALSQAKQLLWRDTFFEKLQHAASSSLSV
jgi:hypothetical protein